MPCPEVVDAARALIDELEALREGRVASLDGDMVHLSRQDVQALSEGKMMGVLLTDKGPLYAFSGVVSGRALLPGFVPPIYDWTAPNGYFRTREAEISAMPPGPAKALASCQLQEWLFSQYIVLNARGESASISEIFARRGIVAPAGTGDCAAPKLLQAALKMGAQPLAMGEFWYGLSSASEVREQGRFYPSCMGKCGPLLSYMLEGLEVEPNPLDIGFALGGEPQIIHCDEDIIVVDKPAGMLSVPGRVEASSLLEYLRERYGEAVESCHRLDMDTSGLMVFARNMRAKVALEAQFASREVKKSYRARLVAADTPFRRPKKAVIALPLSSDYYDRPRQIVDKENGKLAVTEYEVLAMLPNGEVDVRFYPRTGRTHQLRVHAAHKDGLARPIKGDRLYGAADGGRLYLHAESLEFRHPATGAYMRFSREL